MDPSTWNRDPRPWADVIIDLRGAHDYTPGPLPHTLPAPIPDRSIRVDGWHAVPHTLPDGPTGGSTSILILHAPDQWRGALVLTQHSGPKFTFAGVTDLLPYLGRLLSPGNGSQATLNHHRTLAARGLPMLRDTMTNPLSWDPHIDDETTGDSFPLMWASSGVVMADADILYDHGVEPATASWTPNRDLRHWDKHGWTPHEVAQWVQAGVRDVATAKKLTRHGFTASEAFDWATTPIPPATNPALTRKAIAAGWTPAGIRALTDVVYTDFTDHPGDLFTKPFYRVLAEWADQFRPADANALLCAGMSLNEAITARDTGTLPDIDALEFMAALRPPAPNLILTPRQLGDPATARNAFKARR